MTKNSNTYFGGKGADGTYQTIINVIRPHDVYVALFAGFESVAQKKLRAVHGNILIEIDPAVCERLGVMFPDFDVLNVSAFDFLVWLIEWVKVCGLRVCVYADPPYPLDTRSSRHRYRFEISFAQHTQLLMLLKRLECDVLVSTYPNKKYKRMLKGWRLIEFMSKTRRGMRKEWLFMNYQAVDALHDDTYLGRTHRERQLIRKKARRWVKNFAALPVLQRNYILRQLTPNP